MKLQERKPELTAEIMAFRDSLLSSTISDTLEVWELKGTHHVCQLDEIILLQFPESSLIEFLTNLLEFPL